MRFPQTFIRPVPLPPASPEGLVKKAKAWYAVAAIQLALEIPDAVPHDHCISLDGYL